MEIVVERRVYRISRQFAFAAAGLMAFAICIEAYGADPVQLPAPPNATPPTGFVQGVGATLGPFFLSGELTQGFRFTDNLQHDANEIRAIEYIPSATLTAVATDGHSTLSVTGTFTGDFPVVPKVPFDNTTETVTAVATVPLTQSTSLTGNYTYTKTFVETFMPAQFWGEIRDDIWTHVASLSLAHQTQRFFFNTMVEHNDFETDLTTIIGPIRTHSDMARTEQRITVQSGLIGQDGQRFRVFGEVNHFDYEATELDHRDSIGGKLGAGWSGKLGKVDVHVDAQAIHKRFSDDLPAVLDVEAALSLQWDLRETTTLMATFARVIQETNMLDSTGIDANQLYVSWRERLTDAIYVQSTFMYSIFHVRELDDLTRSWTAFFDAAYAFTPHAYLKLAASHAHQRTDSAGRNFNTTQVEVSAHFTF